MRHGYFRLVIGVIWLVVASVCAVRGNDAMMTLYALLGSVFVYKAYTTWKRGKKKGDRYEKF